QLESLNVSRGHYLASGVVVAAVLEMRALPFEVIFVCGLGEGRFPAAEKADPLDLMNTRRLPGDVSPSERDRYLFLQTLPGARKRLYLSYVARDAQTGDALEPSPLIHELLRHMHGDRAGDPLEYWVTAQPLRRYDDEFYTFGSRASGGKSRQQKVRG